MKKKLFLVLCLLVAVSIGSMAQRRMETLDRGLVAMKANGGVFVSWRLFGEEYYDVTYNLYRDGSLITSGLTATNYQDWSANGTGTYTVSAVVRGVEQPQSKPASVWASDYMEVPMAPVYDRQGNDVTSEYEINDCCAADMDGDGVMELVVKRMTFVWAETTLNHMIEIYNMEGQRLWYIDIGPNMVSGPDGQFDAVAYDWDQDGCAELLMRGADNMIIHKADGTTVEVGDMTVDTRNTVSWTANLTYTNTGAEYLLYLNGLTGEPYQITDYPLPRVSVFDWGDGYGHRATKHYFGAPYLDGQHPSIFLGRGCYTQHKMIAYDVDPQTHQLNQRWYWEQTVGGPWWGQGYHNYGIADVDWDGRDEIVFGSMIIDDNGKGLSTTGLGHGDAQHCADLDPYRHGHEIFACLEDEAGCDYRDATTARIYNRVRAARDDGRCMAGNFSNRYPGSIGVSSRSGGAISSVTDKNFYPSNYDPCAGVALNFRLYWTGDLCEETFNYGGMDASGWMYGVNPGLSTGDDWTCLKYFTGCITCNSTKGTPCLTADLFGDWRDEVVMRKEDNSALRIWTTDMPSKWRIYTQMHDTQYRNGVVWQMCGYNQPQHLGYFLGEMEGYTVAPPPLMTNGRTVIQGGTIGTDLNDQHVLVFNNGDNQVTVAEGAKPYILTVNTPSWVQGTAGSNVTVGGQEIKYDYYTTTMTGALLTGPMRLVKQGDGELVLPTGEHSYTGETNIWAGTVSLDGSLTGSRVWMNRFARLNLSGQASKGITMEYAAELSPSGRDMAGSVTTDTLLMKFGSRLVVDLFAEDGSCDKLSANVLWLTTQNWELSPQYNRPVLEFVMHPAADGSVEGTYEFAEAEKMMGGDISTFTVEGMGSYKYELAREDGKLLIKVHNLREATKVTWTGSTTNEWDLVTTQNFWNAGLEDYFVTGDTVVFNDDAQNTNITLGREVQPGGIVFANETKNYTISGTGSIIGKAPFRKDGSGKVAINTTNSFTGPVRISGGTVQVKTLADNEHEFGGLGPVRDASDFVLEHGGTLAVTDVVVTNSDFTLGEGGGVLQNAGQFDMSGHFLGKKLTKRGAGVLSMLAESKQVDSLIVEQGTLVRFESNHPVKDVIVLKKGATLSDWDNSRSYSIYEGHIDVPEGSTATWNLDARAIYFDKLTGGGTVTVSGSAALDRADLALDLSEFTGVFKPSRYCRFCTDKGMPNGTLNLNGLWISNLGKTFEVGKLVGTGTLGGITGAVDARAGVAGDHNIWIAGNDENWSWAGVVDGNSEFRKKGCGKVSLTGVFTTSGNITVLEGELHFGSSASLGTGKLIVNEGAVLSGYFSSKSAKLKNSSLDIKGTVSAGANNLSTFGTFRLNNVDAKFSETSTLSIGIGGPSTATAPHCTQLAGVKTLTMNGTISIRLGRNCQLAAGDSVQIVSAQSITGTPKFELPELENGLKWDTSDFLSLGLLRVEVDPTGINSIAIDDERKQVIYEISGRKVNNISRPGIYIVGGKKTIVK